MSANEQVKEDIEELKNRLDEFFGCPPNYDDELKMTLNNITQYISNQDNRIKELEEIVEYYQKNKSILKEEKNNENNTN